MPTLRDELARIVAAAPDMADLALDIQGTVAARGEAEATALARVVADCAERLRAARARNCLGWRFEPGAEPHPAGPVRGERLPGRHDRRVVWVGDVRATAKRRERMGELAGGDLPEGATHWTTVGSDCWFKVSGA